MTRLPRLKGKELVRLLEKVGFEIVRTRASHLFLRHAGETVGPGLLRSILRDVELSVDDLMRSR